MRRPWKRCRHGIGQWLVAEMPGQERKFRKVSADIGGRDHSAVGRQGDGERFMAELPGAVTEPGKFPEKEESPAAPAGPGEAVDQQRQNQQLRTDRQLATRDKKEATSGRE